MFGFTFQYWTGEKPDLEQGEVRFLVLSEPWQLKWNLKLVAWRLGTQISWCCLFSGVHSFSEHGSITDSGMGYFLELNSSFRHFYFLFCFFSSGVWIFPRVYFFIFYICCSTFLVQCTGADLQG